MCLGHVAVYNLKLYIIFIGLKQDCKVKMDIDPTCDRCGQGTAALIHMFWTCSKLNNFWESILIYLSITCKTSVKPCPFMGLFG